MEVGYQSAAGSHQPVTLLTPLPQRNIILPPTPLLYRSGVTAADVIAVPGTVTCSLLTGVGSLTAGTYTIFVVAKNAFGRTTAKQGNTTVVTTGADLGARAAFAAVTGATHYDIYCSTNGASAKWVGRVTEAQRASGIIINGVGTTTAGGTAGAVDIYAVGTGLAVDAGYLNVNTAYAIPADAAINCAGYQFVDVDVAYSRTGDAAAPALGLIALAQDSLDSAWYQIGSPSMLIVNFGGQTGQYDAMQQRWRFEVRGAAAFHLLVASIAGTGASVDMRAVLS